MIWCRIVRFRDVHPCDMVLRCPVSRCPTLLYGAALSGSAMSTLAIWCHVVQSRDVSPHNFDGLAMSSSAFSVALLPPARRIFGYAYAICKEVKAFCIIIGDGRIGGHCGRHCLVNHNLDFLVRSNNAETVAGILNIAPRCHHVQCVEQKQVLCAWLLLPKIHYTRFPVDGEAANLLRTCCRLVSDTANKSATSRCNGIWETTRHNRHKGLLPEPTCYGLVTDLLRGNWCNGF